MSRLFGQLTRWIGFDRDSQKSTEDELQKAVDRFGPPSAIDRDAGGGAIWYAKDLQDFPYRSVQITDETFRHSKPVPHADFITYSIPFIAKSARIHQIEAYSKSIWYDRLGELLFARCHFHGANVATLALAILLLHNKIPKTKRNTAKKRAQLYKDFILSTATGTEADKGKHISHYEAIIKDYVDSIMPEWHQNKRELRG